MKKYTWAIAMVCIALLHVFAFGGCDALLEEPYSHDHTYTATTIAPSCTEDGYTLFECECGEGYKDKLVQRLGHDFGEPTYIWSDDCTSCTAQMTCNVCGEVITEVQNATITAGNCESTKYVHTYMATFESPGFATQSMQSGNYHKFVNEVEQEAFLCHEANCEEPLTYYRSCDCGKIGTDTFTVGEKLTHKIIDGNCAYCGRSNVVCTHYSVDEILLEPMEGLCSPALCSCTTCKEVFYKDLTYADIDMPIIYFDITFYYCELLFPDQGKVNVENVGVKYTSAKTTFEDSCTLKIQGSSSTHYPKKNYNIKLSSKVKLVDEWGKEKKYCLKANYMDFSQARNIISGKLYGQVVHSRGIDDEVDALPNGGAVDGYPVLVYVANTYFGLYTLNIPKEKWLMGMKASDEKEQAMLSTNNHWDSVEFRSTIDWETDGDTSWEFEFYSNEESEIDDDFTWAIDGLNNLITFVNTATDEEFKKNVKNYINFERTLDCLLFSYLICGVDNFGKNIIWVTFDGGNTWQPSPYDMDDTWGLYWNGELGITEPSYNDIITGDATNNLYKRIYACFYDEFTERYAELRKSVLSYANIASVITSFESSIYAPLWDLEREKWYTIPSKEADHYKQMLEWANARLDFLDELWLSEKF